MPAVYYAACKGTCIQGVYTYACTHIKYITCLLLRLWHTVHLSFDSATANPDKVFTPPLRWVAVGAVAHVEQATCTQSTMEHKQGHLAHSQQ